LISQYIPTYECMKVARGCVDFFEL
jgi:hypothetical protein